MKLMNRISNAVEELQCMVADQCRFMHGSTSSGFTIISKSGKHTSRDLETNNDC